MFPYKDDNPTTSFPSVTIGIISLNIVVFILQVLSSGDGQRIVFAYGAIPHNIVSFESTQPIHPFLTIFTSMFMHGGLFHIFGNMLYLWIFGNNIEDRLGHIRFIIFYLFCGIAAALSHVLTAPGSNVPMIGASGAVSGVLGAYLLLFPYARIHTVIFLGFFVQTVQIPALIVIGFWAIIQVVNGLIAQGALNQGGVAWFAHVGGFIAGLITIKLWQPRRSITW
jgi:membrane associated rhomboid family serine protease